MRLANFTAGGHHRFGVVTPTGLVDLSARLYACYSDGGVRDFQVHSNRVTVGKNRQRLDMSDLIFGFGELVAYISQIYAQQPGDTILTGSPAGIGALTQNWLPAGARVETEIPAVGTLGNPVVAAGRDAE